MTDQEIAFLKFHRRTLYHGVKLEPGHNASTSVLISDQELHARGIDLPREPYVEYNKRPPHDFYL